jgi:ubiquinone/menaquinone biosynthesis C-methylase UbiE
MTDQSQDTGNPSFDGLAASYGKFRPGYPTEILEAIAEKARQVEAAAARAIDVGAGTGISTRALAGALRKRWHLIGLEPSADMRETAASETGTGASIEYRDGTSDVLPAGPGEIGLVLVAQALHWFDRPAFYTEVQRVLAPGGVLAILYNDRDATTPLIQAFETLMETEVTSYSRDYRAFDYVGELRALDWVAEVEIRDAHWVRPLSPEGFAGLMLSRANTKAYLERVEPAVATARVESLAQGYAEDGVVELGYRTRAAMAVRAR